MPANIAVLVKQIPDPSQVGSLDENFRFVREGKIVIDDADLYGVEVALQLKEKLSDAQVIAVSMAPDEQSSGLRTALQMGADKAVVISDPDLANAHSLATAKVLNAAIEKIGECQLIISGTESSDGYAGTLPAQIAALRNISALTFATSVDLDGTTITTKRQSNDSLDTLKAQLPCVVSVTAGVVEPRYPNFKDIMAAKSKPVDTYTLADLELSKDDLEVDSQQVVSLEDAPGRSSGEKIEDISIAADKIIEFLENAGAL
ncbi:MAG: electron transfer flavoprotein subunit beta/FixA family protein [Acidimicrobiia bacterium]